MTSLQTAGWMDIDVRILTVSAEVNVTASSEAERGVACSTSSELELSNSKRRVADSLAD